MPHIPDTKELLFDGLHQGLRESAATGLHELIKAWPADPTAIDIFRAQAERHTAAYLAACDVVTAMVILT